MLKENKKMTIPKRYKFIIELGKALHICGVPSYKIQIYLQEIAKKKGIQGSFMDTPTWINYVFYEEDENTYNYTECVPPGEINLGALSKVIEITQNVTDNTYTFSEAYSQIKGMDYRSFGYGRIAEFFAFVFAGGGFSMIINPNWTSAFAAAFASAIIYFITLLADKSIYIKSILETLVSFVSTMLIGLLSTIFKDIYISLTVLSSIIIFIPGLSLTTALEEITARNLVSGTAKLFDAIISLFKQWFGVVLGLSILPLFVDIHFRLPNYNIPSVFTYFAIFLLCVSLIVSFKVRLKDAFFSILTGGISFCTTILLEPMGILLSIFAGTIVTTTISKVLGRLTKTSRLVFLIPGLIMLVPGSKAFIGLSSFFIKDDVSNTIYSNMGEQVLFIFMGIIGGLIFSGAFMENRHSIK